MSRRVVVLTGASSGIGAAIARRLGARDGYRLVLAARDAGRLATVAGDSGPDALVVPTDVTRRDDVERLRDAALNKFGVVDVWINNAGQGISRPGLELSDDDIDQTFLVNTKSALYGMQAIAPHFMSRGQGHLINVSSMLSRVPTATFRSAYSAAKAALNIFTADVRVDLQARHPRIAVSLLLPGAVPTAFQRNAIGGTPAFNPPGVAPPQTPEEIADANPVFGECGGGPGRVDRCRLGRRRWWNRVAADGRRSHICSRSRALEDACRSGNSRTRTVVE